MSPLEWIGVGFAGGVVVGAAIALWQTWREIKRERRND